MTLVIAQALHQSGKLREALDILNAVDDPSQNDVQLEYFYIYFKLDDIAGAKKAFGCLKSANPNHRVQMLSLLGLMMRRRKLHSEAVEEFTAAEECAGENNIPLPEWFHSELSGAYFDLKSWDLCLRTALTGMSLKPALGLTATTALLNLARVEEAQEQLSMCIDGLSGEPARGDWVLAVCRALLAADHTEKSVQIVSKALSTFTDSGSASDIRIELAIAKGAWAEAALVLSQSANSGGINIASVLSRLNSVLQSHKELWQKYAYIFEEAVVNNSCRDDILFQLRTYLSIELDEKRVIDWLLEFQYRRSVIIPALLMDLVRHVTPSDLLTRFSLQIDTWRRSMAFNQLQRFLGSLSHFNDASAETVESVASAPYNFLRLFVLCRTPNIKVIRVRDRKPADMELLREIGVNADRTAEFLDDFIGFGSKEWADYLDNAVYSSNLAREIVVRDEAFVGFQDRIVRDRKFSMIDPLNGSEADLFDSVKIFDRQVFSFKGSELVLFISGGNMNFALFIYLVSKNVLIAVDTSDQPSRLSFYASDRYMCEIMAVYIQRAAKNYASFVKSAHMAAKERDKPKRVFLIHGRAENPAHHIWNYLPPFERLALADLCSNISTLIPPPTEYFGNLIGLYPELATDLKPLPELAAIDPCPFNPSAIGVQMGASFIPKGLLGRVRKWALTEVSGDRLKWVGDHSTRFPIIWVGLRVFDKTWVRQSEGLAMIVDLVRAQYPEALFVLDGFSLPGNDAQVPVKWSKAVEALKTIVNEIQQKTAHPEAILSLVGNTLAESVIWAEKTHLYFTPLGSSQHKIGWFSSAAGIVYTSSSLAGRLPSSLPGAWEAEGCSVPRFIIGKIADPGQRRDRFDYRSNLENVDFEASEAASMILDIIAEQKRARLVS